MNTSVKIFFLLMFVGCAGWSGWNIYSYFFDTEPPLIILEGIKNGDYCAGDVACFIKGKDAYKVGTVSLWLDGKPLVNDFKINAQSFERPFSLATKQLTQGRHQLRVAVADASYQKNTTTQELIFYVDNIPLQAALVKFDNDAKVFQGKTMHMQFQTNKEIKQATIHALSNQFMCVPEAPQSLIFDCFIPIKSDEAPNEYLYSIEIIDHVGNKIILDNKFHVVLFPFKKQQLVLKGDKVKTENELGLPEKQLEEDIKYVTEKSARIKLWQGTFYIPCDMRGVSTEFGTIRITQERGKYQHNAVDILGTPRSVVWAAQDGTIVIKNRYAHSGLTVGIDHGCGVISLYFHLENFANIEIGDTVKKGSPVGTLGMSGYASGYHLHFELRVMNVAIDPIQWTKPDF
ncbi:MAG: M23 family metallopeptidase [Candidatus Babeliaceae bacterium]